MPTPGTPCKRMMRPLPFPLTRSISRLVTEFADFVPPVDRGPRAWVLTSARTIFLCSSGSTRSLNPSRTSFCSTFTSVTISISNGSRQGELMYEHMWRMPYTIYDWGEHIHRRDKAKGFANFYPVDFLRLPPNVSLWQTGWSIQTVEKGQSLHHWRRSASRNSQIQDSLVEPPASLRETKG